MVVKRGRAGEQRLDDSEPREMVCRVQRLIAERGGVSYLEESSVGKEKARSSNLPEQSRQANVYVLERGQRLEAGARRERPEDRQRR